MFLRPHCTSAANRRPVQAAMQKSHAEATIVLEATPRKAKSKLATSDRRRRQTNVLWYPHRLAESSRSRGMVSRRGHSSAPVPVGYEQTEREETCFWRRRSRWRHSNIISRKRVPRLPRGVVCVMLCLAGLTEYQLVTHGQRDRQSDRHKAIAYTALA